MTFLLLITAGCGKAQSEAEQAPSEPSVAAEEAPRKTVADAEALIRECRFDEAYELLLTLKEDPEAKSLLDCFIEFPSFTVDYPEEEKEDEYFGVTEAIDDSVPPIYSLSFNLAPFTEDETDGLSNYRLDYDENGRIIRFSADINADLDKVTIDYEYSEDGGLKKASLLQTADRNRAPKRTYSIEVDADGRPTRVFNDTESYLYTYKDGLLSEMQLQDSYHAYHYEYFYENGLLKTVNLNGKLDIGYEYDENGRLLKVESKSNAAESKTVVYETDENGKETRTERFGNGSIRKYDEKGNLTYYEGLTEGYGNLPYDENGRLISAEWSVNYTKQSVLFTYDENGHMASAAVTKNSRTVVYTFTEYKAYYIPDANIRNALRKELYFGAKRVE